MSKNRVISIKEIETIYREYCKEKNLRFSQSNFIKFLNFLEIDFYDWIKENLRCYFKEEQE